MSVSIGVPTEIMSGERRVALDPVAVNRLARAGMEVRLQRGAGEGAGFQDGSYRDAGGVLVSGAEGVWASDIVVKVKEPQTDEYVYLRQGLRLFCFLHLAANRELAETLAARGVEAYAFETLTERGRLPLLAPMSEIAGRAAAIVAGTQLAAHVGGSGTLLGGAAGVPSAKAIVIGLGVAGTAAARGLRGLDAHVVGVDVDLERLWFAQRDGTVATTLASAHAALAEAVIDADVVIGSALIPGARTPVVLSCEHVASMRLGAVIIDLAVDQGGCVETTRPTTLSDPVYDVSGILHYAVKNVPGQYPRTASRALSAALGPRVLKLAIDPSAEGLTGACNVSKGVIVHPAVAESLGRSRTQAADLNRNPPLPG